MFALCVIAVACLLFGARIQANK